MTKAQKTKAEILASKRQAVLDQVETLAVELTAAQKAAEFAEALAQVDRAAQLLAEARSALAEAERLSGEKWRVRLAEVEAAIPPLEAKEAQAVADLAAVMTEKRHLEEVHQIRGGSDRLRTRAQRLRSSLGKLRHDLGSLRAERDELTAKLV